jgi:hypothetical protein
MIEAQLNVQEGRAPVTARLVVDIGCQLEGVLSSDFVRHQGWQAIPLSTYVHTADGRKHQGLPGIVANSHLAPGFTRQISYGVLDLPGFDGLLGVGFLNQFQPFSITVTSATQRGLTLTNPKTHKPVHIRELGWDSWAAASPIQSEADSVQPPVGVQWEAPSTEDLDNIVSAFHIRIDPDSGQILLVDAEEGLPGEPGSVQHLEHNCQLTWPKDWCSWYKQRRIDTTMHRLRSVIA